MFYVLMLGAVAMSMAYSLNSKVILNSPGVKAGVYACLIQIFVGLVSILVALFVGFGFDFNKDSIWMLFAMTATYGIASSLYYRSLQMVDLSEATILDSNSILWTQVFGFLFLSEKTSLIKIIAATLILVAIIIVGYRKTKAGFKFSKYGILLIVAGGMYALGAVWDKLLLNYAANSLSYLPLSFLLAGIVAGLINIKDMNKPNLGVYFGNYIILSRLVIGSVFLSATYVLIFYAYKEMQGQISVVYPILQIESVILPILGIVFLKERKHIPQKLVAALLAFAGVILISR